MFVQDMFSGAGMIWQLGRIGKALNAVLFQDPSKTITHDWMAKWQN